MSKLKRVLIIGMLTTTILAAVLVFAQSASALRNEAGQQAQGNYGVSLSIPGEFLTGPNAGAPIDIVTNYISDNHAALGLTAADVSNYAISDMYSSQHNGVTHIYLRQQHNSIGVYGAILNANVTSDGRIINIGNRFVSDLANVAVGANPAISAEAAVSAAANSVGLSVSEPLVVQEAPGGATQAVVFSNGGISLEAIPVELVYQPVANGQARLAWDVTIYELSTLHWWSIRVDAANGAVLDTADWVVHENVAHEGDTAAYYGPFVESGYAAQDSLWSPQAASNPDEYRVFAYPKESPYDGPDTLEVDPADTTSNPFGWHDTDGAAGAEFTITRGNNVYADTDLDANNTPDGNSPDGGAGLSFDIPINLDQDPSMYIPSAIINLFYWNNLMHDITYLYGFTEAAGNFQENNYGNGGVGSDSVNADAQDGSGTNNANFGTPPDGNNPRMQMFRWTTPFGQAVTVTAPVSITGVYTANPSNNGGTAMGLAGDIVLVIDATPPINDACEALTNDLTGDIALIVWNEGACNSSVFVQNAANAGAIAAIIIDNLEIPLTNFGGSAAIPSVAIGASDGQLFLGALNNTTVTGSIGDNPVPSFDRDSDMDAGIIAHEYGHGVSNRLTGGPANTNCLGNQEQMGEGWSDLMTLFIHAAAGDTGPQARGIGTYALFDAPDGLGIRNFPYSTDLNVNPQTYVNIGSTNVPHGVGEIWAAMVWEVYWNLVDKYGFNADIYGDWTTGGNNLTFQLLMDGMKIQPCFPGFVDGRDAILAADLALTQGANQCEIWAGFAKRGVGFSADQGSNFILGDETEAFDLPAACGGGSIAIDKSPATQNVVTGGNANFTITVTNTGAVTLSNVTVSDPLVPDCDNAIGNLGISATVSYGCMDVGVTASYTNVATVTGQLATGGPGVTATASAVVNVSNPTSVSLTGIGDNAAAFSPILLVVILSLVVGLGFVIRRKVTA